LGVHAQAPRNDEIGELVQSFNAMSDQMQNLFNRVYREQLALKDARIIALQSQINPHFFNNTLELMNWKARMLGDEQLCDMIQALSTLLDSAMDRRNARFVPLKDEMAVADAYLTIISARFGKRMHLVKDVDESRLNSPVPRMILQPLLENAVVHGLEPAGGGTLTLRVVSERADMVVSIINDGIPLTEEDFNHIQDLLTKPVDSSDPRSHHIGIRNVHERLRLIYGEKSGLVFSLDENKRTHCLFRLPPPPPERE
jgi:two-component system sensor histidine kinase YesM